MLNVTKLHKTANAQLMIKCNWKNILKKAGMSQNMLADRVQIDRGFMSRTCSGAGVLPFDALEDCVAVMGCTIADIYDADTIRVLYPQATIRKKPSPKTVCVRIKAEVADGVDFFVTKGIYYSRNEAVNALLRTAIAE